MGFKSGFSLGTPTVKELKVSSTNFSICASAGGQVFTVADIQAIIDAEGIASPNGNPTATVTGVSIAVAPKQRLTIDQQTDTEIEATGEVIVVTEGGNSENVFAGEAWYKSECVTDIDCDSIPDAPLDPTIEFTIPEGSCVKFAVEFA